MSSPSKNLSKNTGRYVKIWTKKVVFFYEKYVNSTIMVDSFLLKFYWFLNSNSQNLLLVRFLIRPILDPKFPLMIPQVKELLIKLAWSTMLGVKEIPKVQTVDLTLYVWLCDKISAFLTAFAISSPFFSLHSLQQLSPSYCIQKWLIQ